MVFHFSLTNSQPTMQYPHTDTHTPAGIMRDRALVDDDLGMLVSVLGEVKWLMVLVDCLLAVSGLSTPSGRDISWSRCSEKLPVQTQWKKSFVNSSHYRFGLMTGKNIVSCVPCMNAIL